LRVFFQVIFAGLRAAAVVDEAKGSVRRLIVKARSVMMLIADTLKSTRQTPSSPVVSLVWEAMKEFLAQSMPRTWMAEPFKEAKPLPSSLHQTWKAGWPQGDEDWLMPPSQNGYLTTDSEVAACRPLAFCVCTVVE